MSKQSILSDQGAIERSSARTWAWRNIKDRLVRHMVEVGGIGVIIAILLIFLFLLSVVWPLFESPRAEEEAMYSVPAAEYGKTLYLSVEEQNEIGMRLTDQGAVVFFNAHTGDIKKVEQLPLPEGVYLSDISVVNESKGLVAAALNTGSFLLFAHRYSPDFSGERRVMIPRVEYPLGTDPVAIEGEGGAVHKFHVGSNDDALGVVVQRLDTKTVHLQRWTKQSSLFGDDVKLESEGSHVLNISGEVFGLLLDQELQRAYVLTVQGELFVFSLGDVEDTPQFNERIQVVPSGAQVSHFSFLNGDISVLIGDSTGRLSQWFHSRDAQEAGRFSLKMIRQFQIGQSAITSVSPELLRKGLLASNQDGRAHLVYTTSERELLDVQVSEVAITRTAVSPRSEFFLAEDANQQIHAWHVDSNYPEASLKSIWGKVWYEDYPQPEYIWQSSSASNDFEPKFSLVPLTFGTLKAAFYAMLFAMPLAICGAIFTAYFMAPRMRRLVKPSIEIMEALPTVILGFLAGLWLAPFVEKHLPGVFSIFIITPFVLLLCAFIWWRLPDAIKTAVPDGWQAALLVPPTIVAIWLCVYLSPYVEAWMFDGDIRLWMQQSYGIDYDQRNAVIIGIAMGFAVIPTIFSIAEDAIFSVPKHLTSGSLALGATPWQTLVRVVMPSASPGIFSAVMIGFGRAVGETMIVLMATGNTPVMDLSIFQGMRTLSANVAVELPESAVGSTHYRILFLAALVLFLFTFFFNTIAEIVRQRLRNKYSNL